ncbi:hypothetical protein D9757_014727 [Collybiopsis confluens]|uniref:NADP-dependent oxidoreductase domain-containing protein n=1 Tax=Collybiopsis confluens TaxID=2823264 RepID=A0A8H5CXQ2_9AGAR|nr:hypothetical protein D9757_014727 [Collybiopsis confluens]
MMSFSFQIMFLVCLGTFWSVSACQAGYLVSQHYDQLGSCGTSDDDISFRRVSVNSRSYRHYNPSWLIHLYGCSINVDSATTNWGTSGTMTMIIASGGSLSTLAPRKQPPSSAHLRTRSLRSASSGSTTVIGTSTYTAARSTQSGEIQWMVLLPSPLRTYTVPSFASTTVSWDGLLAVVNGATYSVSPPSATGSSTNSSSSTTSVVTTTSWGARITLKSLLAHSLYMKSGYDGIYNVANTFSQQLFTGSGSATATTYIFLSGSLAIPLATSGFRTVIGSSTYTIATSAASSSATRNSAGSHLEEIKNAGYELPAVNQIELHPFCQQKPIVDYCIKNSIIVQAYCPIIRGQMDHEVFESIAAKHERELAQILIRWSLQKGYIPLPKSATTSRIHSNAKVFDFELDAEDMDRIDALDQGKEGAISWNPVDAE